MATALESLQNKESSITDQLRSSDTAYAPNTVPTIKDAGLTMQLASLKKQVDDARSKALRNEWYGNPTTEEAPMEQKPGLLMSALQGLQKPLNAVAGTAQYMLGKGTEPTLTGNINKAMSTGYEFGNLLNEVGVTNRLVQIPLGFALDVGMDPVTMLTMGTSALVPRIGTGLIKGGLERGAVETGAELGSKGAITGYDAGKALKAGYEGMTSNLASKASKALDMVPFAKTMSKWPTITEDTLTSLGKEGGLSTMDRLKNLGQKFGTKVTDLSTNLGEKAITGSETYDNLIGSSIKDRLNKGMFGESSGVIGKTVEKWVSSIPKIPGTNIAGADIVKFFKYSPEDAAKVSDLKDQITNLYDETGLDVTKSDKYINFVNIDDALAKGAVVNIKDLTKTVANSVISSADDVGNVLIRDQVTGDLIPELKGKIRVADTIDNAKTVLGTAMDQVNIDHLNKVYNKVMPGQTGVQWYDDLITKVKATNYSDIGNFLTGKGWTATGIDSTKVEQAMEPGVTKLAENWNTVNGVANKFTNLDVAHWQPFEKALNGLGAFTSIFKWMKVPLNAGSHVVAQLGNYFMGMMMGLPVGNLEYLSSVRKASKLLEGKLGIEGIREMFFKDGSLMIDMAENHPARFQQVFGFDVNELINKIGGAENVLAQDLPKGPEELFQYFQQAFQDIENATSQISHIDSVSTLKQMIADGTMTEKDLTSVEKKALAKQIRIPTAGETAFKAMKEGTLTQAEQAGTFTSEELNSIGIERFRNNAANYLEAHPNNIGAIITDFVVNKMPRSYEHIDQSFKIGTVDYLSRIGLTEQELVTVSRTIPIDMEKDLLPVVKSGGQKLYKLTPLKASEVAMETYMNYAAMPDFVKVMRAMPLVGSNFYSFQYAMAIKSGKTAIANLAAFNKIGFMLNEINGTRSPEEKIAMENKYQKYLNSPTVIKLLGIYNTDVKNIIPIYGMNMFNPSEKTYSDTPQGNFLKALDMIPLGQNPIGQVVKDYWVQPWVLSGTGQVAEGQFGQALYPAYDADGNLVQDDLKTRLAYGARTLAESVVPGVAGYLGFPLAAAGASEGLINAMPSYRMRTNAFAYKGETSIGATAKEDAVRRGIRALFGTTGIPIYPLDTTNISTKDLIKPKQ